MVISVVVSMATVVIVMVVASSVTGPWKTLYKYIEFYLIKLQENTRYTTLSPWQHRDQKATFSIEVKFKVTMPLTFGII